MRRIFLRTLAVVILVLADMAFAGTPNRITILYDSFGKSPTLTMDWGFAALLEYGDCAAAERFWSPHYIQHNDPRHVENLQGFSARHAHD